MAQDAPRYKGFAAVEREARRQLEKYLDDCKSQFTLLSPEHQQAVVMQLRPLAQRSILHALEGRSSKPEKHFGYEWENALTEFNQNGIRGKAAKYLLESMPEISTPLTQPELLSRIQIEWLHEQTAGRIQNFTPYLVQEEAELINWKEQCPEAYKQAETLAKKISLGIQDRTRTLESTGMSDKARELSMTAYLIAARKLFLLSIDIPEYFEEKLDSISVKIPMELQACFAPKVYLRFGLNPQPVNYQPPTEGQKTNYTGLLSGMNGNILKNLQEALCPWTAEQALNQKIGANLLADAYFNVVKPGVLNPTGGQLDDAVYQKLNQNLDRYRLLGFIENLSSEQAEFYLKFINGNAELKSFLNRPSISAAFIAHRVDQTLVQICLNASIATELVRTTKAWRPQAVSTQDHRIVAQAKSTLPHIMQDLSLYHNAILKTNYLQVRQQDFYKEFLWNQYLATVSEKERIKLESFYKVMAVVATTRKVEPNPTIPTTWEKLGTYVDAATQLSFTDYQWTTADGLALISMSQGASVDIAQQAVDKLFNLKGSGCVDYPDVQGVRISEYSFNELKTSCLNSRSIARMQFYSSFSAKETLEILKGSADEPSEENVIESLRPCFVLKYKDHVYGERFYCRIKPAEMVRVKYRTPTGETKNPCWDASTIIGNLSPAQLQKRLNDPTWSLLMIEGEKKAAMLAQMALDLNLPIHVISLPGVWMGVAGPKKGRRLVSEIAQFQMASPDGKTRKCLIFFDNDKAFNAAVMDALLQTAGVLQKEGARVYIPHLPFGKKQKGADDYALIACQTPTGIDFAPLVKIINDSVLIPKPPPLVKYPTEDQKRTIAKFLDSAEHIDELQKQVKREGTGSAKLAELFALVAPQLLKLPSEEVALQLLNGQDEKGKQSLMNIVTSSNPALTPLKEACTGIPDIETGPRFSDN